MYHTPPPTQQSPTDPNDVEDTLPDHGYPTPSPTVSKVPPAAAASSSMNTQGNHKPATPKTPNKKRPTEALETAEPEAEGLEVPDLHDTSAAKPKLGVPQISPQAMRMRSQRVFTPRTNGTLKVSQQIFDEWHSKGPRRTMLEGIFAQCGYSPDWVAKICPTHQSKQHSVKLYLAFAYVGDIHQQRRDAARGND